MSATRLIQTAIYGLLSADATLPTLSRTVDPNTGSFTTVTVHNDIPEGETYPHVLISKASEVPWNTGGGASAGIGWRDIIRIHVYSRYQGDIEAMEIYERIVALLHYQPLTIAGYSTVLVDVEQMRIVPEDIEKLETRHLVGEFKVLVHP